MKTARGDVRKLLITLGDIQTLAGRAQGVYLNDRSTERAEKLVPMLQEIFDKCVETRSEYYPI